MTHYSFFLISSTIGLNYFQQMLGTWQGAFGSPYIHISDAVMGLSLSVGPLVPSRLKLGASICLGKHSNCDQATGDFIKGKVYGQISLKDPDENFILAMVTEVSLSWQISVCFFFFFFLLLFFFSHRRHILYVKSHDYLLTTYHCHFSQFFYTGHVWKNNGRARL